MATILGLLLWWTAIDDAKGYHPDQATIVYVSDVGECRSAERAGSAEPSLRNYEICSATAANRLRPPHRGTASISVRGRICSHGLVLRLDPGPRSLAAALAALAWERPATRSLGSRRLGRCGNIWSFVFGTLVVSSGGTEGHLVSARPLLPSHRAHVSSRAAPVYRAFNNQSFGTAHWVFALLFLIFTGASAVLQYIEIAFLARSHTDRKHLRRNAVIKLWVIGLAFVGASGFIVT